MLLLGSCSAVISIFDAGMGPGMLLIAASIMMFIILMVRVTVSIISYIFKNYSHVSPRKRTAV
jgi:hypothetical protein